MTFLNSIINLNIYFKLIIQGFKSLKYAIIQPSDLRRKLLQEVVQDHNRGLTGEVRHGYWCQGIANSAQDSNSQYISQA